MALQDVLRLGIWDAGRAFWDWWIGELSACLPRAWRVQTADRPFPEMHLSNDVMQLDFLGDDHHTHCVTLDEDTGVPPSAAFDVPEIYKSQPARIVIPHNLVLERELELPMTPRHMIRGLLTHELARHSPLPVEQVQFDHRVLEASKQSGHLRVALVIVRQTTIDMVLRLAHSLEVPVGEIGYSDSSGTFHRLDIEGVNFVRRPIKPEHVRQLLLAAACMVLIVANLIVMQQRGAERLAEIDSELAQARSIGLRTAEVAQELEAIRARRSALLSKFNGPTMSEVLSAASSLVPETANLTSIRIEGESVRLAGEAQEASQVLAAFEASPLFKEAKWNAPVTRDPRTEKERFQLSFQMEEAGWTR